MNRHDDSGQRVSAWLDDEARGELPDRVLDQTFTTTRSTPQHRGLRRLSASPGRGGSTTSRRSNVFTFAAVSALAVSVVFAAGVLVDMAEPSTPGAEAPTITVEEEPFTGTFAYGPGCEDEPGGESGYCWEQIGVRFDDPRFDGSVTMWANADHTDEGVYRNQFTITTDEGAWVGDSVPGLLTTSGNGVPSVHLFTGEGAYEGLHAIASVDLTGGVFMLEGYVVHGGFPELP